MSNACNSLPSITHITEEHLVLISGIVALGARFAVSALPGIRTNVGHHVQCQVYAGGMNIAIAGAALNENLRPVAFVQVVQTHLAFDI